jgi:hypothetical protein
MVWQLFNLLLIVFQLFYLAIPSRLMANSSEFRFSALWQRFRRIYDNVFSSKSFSASLVFELWSELEWIGPSAFQYSRLQYLFLPQSVNFIGSFGFANCESLVCIYFQCHSSLWQLKSQNFTGLSKLRAITIPVSIRQIHETAFFNCGRLLCVTFESPSQCWYISFDAFSNCPRLQSFFLPPSLEVIDSTLSSHLLRFYPSDGSHFCVENDCLVRIADQKLILYMGASPIFSVGAEISIVSEDSFARNNQLENIVFDSHSHLKLLPARAFSFEWNALLMLVGERSTKTKVLTFGENIVSCDA